MISFEGFGDKPFKSTAIDQMHSVFIGNMKALKNNILHNSLGRFVCHYHLFSSEEFEYLVITSIERPMSGTHFIEHMILVSTTLLENELMWTEQERNFKLYITVRFSIKYFVFHLESIFLLCCPQIHSKTRTFFIPICHFRWRGKMLHFDYLSDLNSLFVYGF